VKSLKLVSKAKVAQLCGVSKQAIGKAVKSGRCPTVQPEKGLPKIDLEDPIVRAFMRQAEQNKRGYELANVSKPKEEKQDPRIARAPVAEDAFLAEHDELKIRKLSADADLQETKAKIKSTEYFERVGAIVDIESLRRKMGRFTDVLITDLLYLPEEIADQLWLRAKAAGEGAPKVIREVLADRIEVIVESAKRAARDIVPPEADRRYSVIDEPNDA